MQKDDKPKKTEYHSSVGPCYALLIALFITLPVFTRSLSAQEGFSVNIGMMEGGGYSVKNFAWGYSLSVDYAFNLRFSAGIRAGAFHDSTEILTLEPSLFARWYVYRAKVLLFAEGEAGVALFFKNDFTFLWMGSVGAGLRFPLGNWSAEAYLRGGYPFIVGGGVRFAYFFGKKQ
jgi:hypothetical protein